MDNSTRYKQMEQYMTLALIADAGIFLLYLIFAGFGIIWLKVITAILCGLLSCACLAFLYVSKELLKQRSMWMSVAAAAVLVWLLFSRILNFPCPNKYKKGATDPVDPAASVSSYLL